MNKRGLSQVVTTVILILVVLSAIVIIWAAVRPTIQRTSEQISADCFTIELSVAGCSDSLDTNNDKINETNVTISRTAGSGDLTAIKFIFGDGSTIDSPDGTTMPGPLESQTIMISGANHTGQTVNVAAVVGQDNVCSESSSAPITCS
jgi:flagellin-like protein